MNCETRSISPSVELIETLVLTALAIIAATTPAISNTQELPSQEVVPVVREVEDMFPEPIVPETQQVMIGRIANEYKVATVTLQNLVQSESTGNPKAVGDGGCSLGLVQINLCAHPKITKEEALDPEFALRFAAQAISQDKAYQWTVCNCYSYVKVKTKKQLPRMATIVPNSTAKVGSIAIFNYSGLKHIAVVTSVHEGGIKISEANYEPCLTGERSVKLTDPALIGFMSL